MAAQHHIQRDMISSAQSLLNISKKTMFGMKWEAL